MVGDESEPVATALFDGKALSLTPSYEHLIGAHVQCGWLHFGSTPGSTFSGSDKNVDFFGFDPPPTRIQV